jgi:hypothetical protein
VEVAVEVDHAAGMGGRRLEARENDWYWITRRLPP